MRLLLLALPAMVACHIEQRMENHQVAAFERAGLVERTVSTELGDVHLYAGVDGAGEQGLPVLMLHGFHATGTSNFWPQLDLAEEHRLIVPDLLWFGESVGRADTPRTLVSQSDAMVQVLDQLGIDRVHVVGMSYGGFVMADLAHRYPERVERLVWVDAPGPAYTLEDRDLALDRLDVASVEQILFPTTGEDVKKGLQATLAEPPNIPDKWLDVIAERVSEMDMSDRKALVDDLLSYCELELARWTYEQPSLVIWGSQDQLFPQELATRLVGHLDGEVQVRVLPDAAHVPPLEEKDRFNALVGAFLHDGPVEHPSVPGTGEPYRARRDDSLR